MLIARTRPALREALRGLRSKHARMALVPTMGALHDGHVALITQARSLGARVVASIFVNPLQFGPTDDLARYPRDEAGDLARLEAAGCDAAWLPDAADMHPPDAATLVQVDGPALGWEGDLRPGHFRGVATVVAKLFGQVRPDLACFGEKDWQQLQVIRRMTHDLALDIVIEAVPTLREADGLAMSSRNRFLSAAERAIAPSLHVTLRQLRDRLHDAGPAGEVLANARDTLRACGFVVDYLDLVEGSTMRATLAAAPGTRLIAAARLGSVRLLDNIDAG